jgi:hypothetical protein
MTTRTNARIAGAAYLLYIAVAFPKPNVDARVETLFTFISCMCALLLAVSLYAITREIDNDIALLGMVCRVGEGVLGGAALMTKTSAYMVAGSFFAVGSTFFCYLLYRGRLIPRWLAIVGLVGSALMVVVVPLQMAKLADGRLINLAWVPVGIFEVVVAVWFLIKGTYSPQIQLNERS